MYLDAGYSFLRRSSETKKKIHDQRFALFSRLLRQVASQERLSAEREREMHIDQNVRLRARAFVDRGFRTRLARLKRNSAHA